MGKTAAEPPPPMPPALKEPPAQIVATVTDLGVFDRLGQRWGIARGKVLELLQQSLWPGFSPAQITSALVICDQYKLNPFLKQVHLFKNKHGAVLPIVGIDGWLKIAHDTGELEGFDVAMTLDGTKPFSATFTGWKKGHDKPFVVTEYFHECYRKTEPWDTMPMRMLRHKATIQGIRVMWNIGGIYDDDEAQDIIINATAEPRVVSGIDATAEQMKAAMAKTNAKPAAREKSEAPPASDKASADILKRLHGAATRYASGNVKQHELLKLMAAQLYEVESLSDLTQAQAEGLMTKFGEGQDAIADYCLALEEAARTEKGEK